MDIEANVPPPTSRRGFLKAAGASAGALGLTLLARPASSHAAARSASSAGPLTIGVLLPQSSRYPAMAQSFLQGVRLALSGQATADVLAEVYGALPSAAAAAGRRLIEERGADLLLSMHESGVSDALRPLLAETQVPLLIADAGATLVTPQPNDPLVFRHTLGGWRASMALGAWSARALGTTAVVVSSFHDSGFDLNYAFQIGFERAGGEVLDIAVTHLPGQPDALPAALARVAELRPMVLYAGYAGDEAIGFLRALGASGMAGRVALVGGGFLADEALLRAAGPAIDGAATVTSWAPALATAENRAFVRAYRLATGARPDQFAALGYDTARLVVHAAQEGGPRSAAFVQALGAAELAGARGMLCMDPTMREVSAPLYLRQVRGAPLANHVVRELSAIELADPRAQALAATLRSGWLNGYLAV